MSNNKLLHTKHPTGYRWKPHTPVEIKKNETAHFYQKGKLEETEYIQLIAYWQG